MKSLTDKVILILTIMTFLLNGCVEIKMVDDNKTSTKVSNSVPIHGAYAEDIDELLAVAPIGSEVTLDETENGDIYLRIEKVFTAKKSQDKIQTEDIVLEEEPYQEEIDSSLYGDTITI
jgi:PBP1b-binding outer membrane lipoprotein LpoB